MAPADHVTSTDLSTAYCLRCEYALDHLSTNRCPERGQTFDAANPTTFLRLNARSARPLRGALLSRSLVIAALVSALVAEVTAMRFTPTWPEAAEYARWHMVFFLEVAAIVFPVMLRCLFRAGREIGVGYAIGHVVLAVVLMPLALPGLFIVPRMVERDLFRVARGNCG